MTEVNAEFVHPLEQAKKDEQLLVRLQNWVDQIQFKNPFGQAAKERRERKQIAQAVKIDLESRSKPAGNDKSGYDRSFAGKLVKKTLEDLEQTTQNDQSFVTGEMIDSANRHHQVTFKKENGWWIAEESVNGVVTCQVGIGVDTATTLTLNYPELNQLNANPDIQKDTRLFGTSINLFNQLYQNLTQARKAA